ncbi:MAG: hypothetical protein PF447_13245, partial [Spirochaetaceae bacterium]|nr:hypothetical protein [Spirochaetaceae bacterium]
IEVFVEQLNNIISSRIFNEWKSYLSSSYIETYSDAKALEQMSQSPILLNNDIKLISLEDYFNYIVVPSRSNIIVNDIEFQTENRITVWSMFNGRKVKLYQLEKIDNAWLISIW